jgi:hypothetical protein
VVALGSIVSTISGRQHDRGGAAGDDPRRVDRADRRLTVEEGDKVKKGQSIARIRFDAQANALVRANTSLAKARGGLQRGRSSSTTTG